MTTYDDIISKLDTLHEEVHTLDKEVQAFSKKLETRKEGRGKGEGYSCEDWMLILLPVYIAFVGFLSYLSWEIL